MSLRNNCWLLCILLLCFVACSTQLRHSLQSDKLFYVDSYGNDNASISRLVTDVNHNKGGRIVFPRNATFILSIEDDPNGGHYLLPQETSVPFFFKNCSYLDIDLNGSTIVLENNHSSKYAVFLFYNCESFKLINGAIVGDALKHDYSSVVFNRKIENSSHEWGHGVMVMGSKGAIANLMVSYMCGDGIYVASSVVSSDIRDAKIDISHCDVSFCRRNGISCASNSGFCISNSKIHHIGSYGGLIGTDPCAGIDFEYEDLLQCKGDISILGCFFSDCEKKTITSSSVHVPIAKSFYVSNCSFSGSIVQVSNLLADKGKKICNSSFNEAPVNAGRTLFENCSFIMGPKLYYVHGTSFRYCVFDGTLKDFSDPYGCAIVGNSTESALFESCSFCNIRGVNNSSSVYQGFSGYHFPLRAMFKNCIIKNCSFVKGNKKNDSSYSFYGSKLTDGCAVYNLSEDTPITFEKCELTDVSAYQTQTGRFLFKNSTLVQKDKLLVNPLLLFGNNSFDKCTIVDEVGFPVVSAEKYGIKAYKVDAVRTNLTLDSENIKTEGMNLKGGRIHGVSKASFKGSQRSVRFR